MEWPQVGLPVGDVRGAVGKDPPHHSGLGLVDLVVCSAGGGAAECDARGGFPGDDLAGAGPGRARQFRAC